MNVIAKDVIASVHTNHWKGFPTFPVDVMVWA